MIRDLQPVLIETSSGARIHRLPLEVFPNFWAYTYILRKDDYCILIDTGSGTEDSHQHLLDGLEKLDLDPSDLTHILLTHAHIDHYASSTFSRSSITARSNRASRQPMRSVRRRSTPISARITRRAFA
jgi:glyoxylase-like metal-dependent hydrolase (beta-lactamase superfamily II)